jgi:heterodisulfide reductase subunit A
MKKNKKTGPRLGVFVCNCGTNIAGFLDTAEVAEYAAGLPHVVFVKENLYSCSEAGINDIRKGITDNRLDRVVVAACTPRTHEPTFRAACKEAGLNPYFFEFVNIREHVSWVHKEDRAEATRKAKDLIRMGVARAAHLEPMEPIVGEVVRRAVVIGGGVSGMTVALELASRGFEVVLVEAERRLGGIVRKLSTVYPSGRKASVYVKGLAARIARNKRIRVHKSARVTDLKGYVGRYEVSISRCKETVVAGVVVVATGAVPLAPEGLFGYDGKRVITQLELEGMLARSRARRSGPRRVVIIGCAGSRVPERFYCSKICCMTGIKNAMEMRRRWKSEVTFVYRDLMCYGVRNEELLMEAKKTGIRFMYHPPEKPPLVEKEVVKVSNDIVGRKVDIPWDLVVLSTPLVPPEGNAGLSRMLKVPLDEYGFFLEAHVKLRPLDFATDGIFVCGTARWPAGVGECVEQALGAAGRASTYLERGEVNVEPIVSTVDDERCRGCGLCAALCPYGAIEIVETDRGPKARVIEVACKGCGTCGATCYRLAIRMKHFTDQQLTAQIRAAFGGE